MGRPKRQGRCREEGCERDALARHLCAAHYQAAAKRGDFTPNRRLPKGASMMDRLAAYSREVEGGYRIWTGSFSATRTGIRDIPQIPSGISFTRNFRVALWAEVHGTPPPEGWTVRSVEGAPFGCVSPEHLVVEPVHSPFGDAPRVYPEVSTA